MYNETINQLFDVTLRGYVILSRNALEYLLEHIGTHDQNTFYCHLLLEAHFGEPQAINANTCIRRGEVCIDPQELMRFTNWKRSKVYEGLKLLEQADLLIRLKETSCKGHFLLTMYERHCGRALRREEHTPPPTLEESQTEKSFEAFFKYYHFITGTREVDKEKARREWARLSLAEREEAMRNVPHYKDAVPKPEHLKRACSYLKDKSFKF